MEAPAVQQIIGRSTHQFVRKMLEFRKRRTGRQGKLICAYKLSFIHKKKLMFSNI